MMHCSGDDEKIIVVMMVVRRGDKVIQYSSGDEGKKIKG